MVPARHARRACEALRAREHWIKDMYYTYVLKSAADEKFYIGYSEDVPKRLAEHNAGLVDATRNRLPVTLVYYEACRDKQKALQREKYFKTGFGRRFLQGRI